MTQQSASARVWPKRRSSPTKGDRRYDQIYESAARLFYEKGYRSTSLQDLADAVGLQKGSLYHYIDSKEDLLFGITEYSHNFFIELVAEAPDLDKSPRERLEGLLYRHVKFAADHFHVTAAFYNERSAMSVERQQRIVATRDAYEGMLRDLVVEGQRSGEFTSDIDPKLAVFALMGMVNWTHQWYRPDGPIGAEEIATTFARMAVRSLAP